MKHYAWFPATILALLLAGPATASDLSYTYLEFGSIKVDSSNRPSQMAGLQTVRLYPRDGDGLSITGSLALGRHFYLAASYDAAVVDTNAQVTSALGSSIVSGSFDWTKTKAAFGAVVPIGDSLDIVAEITRTSIQYDFGSFVGENFDASASESGLAAGLRWNPRPRLEFSIMALASDAGKVDLSSGEFKRGTRASAAIRWYLWEDIGLGLDVESGDVRSAGVSIRFGFGNVGAGD